MLHIEQQPVKTRSGRDFGGNGTFQREPATDLAILIGQGLLQPVYWHLHLIFEVFDWGQPANRY